MPLVRAADIRPGDSIETAPGQWTLAGRVTAGDGRARVEHEKGHPIVRDDPGGDPTWSVRRPGRLAIWHVRPGDDADRREIVWSDAASA